jgi:hypothetical protein
MHGLAGRGTGARRRSEHPGCARITNQALIAWSIRVEGFMGEVIEGPWRQREGPDLMRALSDEIARMTAALERLRELHKRGEALDLRGDVDAVRK